MSYSAHLSMGTPHVHTSREPRVVLLFDLAPWQNTILLDIFSKVVWVSWACLVRYTFILAPNYTHIVPAPTVKEPKCLTTFGETLINTLI